MFTIEKNNLIKHFFTVECYIYVYTHTRTHVYKIKIISQGA